MSAAMPTTAVRQHGARDQCKHAYKNCFLRKSSRWWLKSSRTVSSRSCRGRQPWPGTLLTPKPYLRPVASALSVAFVLRRVGLVERRCPLALGRSNASTMPTPPRSSSARIVRAAISLPSSDHCHAAETVEGREGAEPHDSGQCANYGDTVEPVGRSIVRPEKANRLPSLAQAVFSGNRAYR